MSTNLHLSGVSVNAALDNVLNALNGGTIKIYTGSQPATPDVAIGAQVLLATLTLSATAFGAASGGTKTANAITAGSAGATGTAAWFRAFKSDGTTAVIDGSVGTSSADLILGTVTVNSGDVISVSSWTVSMAQ